MNPIDFEASKPIISLFCLYCADQEKLYLNYHEGFIRLSNWLINDGDLNPIWLTWADKNPDICCNCGAEQEETFGGRVRLVCPQCATAKSPNAAAIPFSERLLAYYNPPFLAEILGIQQYILEFYFSKALSIYKKEIGKRRMYG